MKKAPPKKERPAKPPAPAKNVTVEVHYLQRSGRFVMMFMEGGAIQDSIPFPSFKAAVAAILKLYGRDAKHATISLTVGGQ